MGFFASSGILNRRGFFGGVATTAPFSPADITGLSLWLKADAGVTMGNGTPFISSIVISGAGSTTSNGTYTRTSGGYTTFTKTGGNYIAYGYNATADGDVWYIADATLDYVTTYYAGDEGTISGWQIDQGSANAPSSTTSNTTPQVVVAWADQSGNGKNATAFDGPLYSTNAINGKPALVFANNAYLTTSNIFNGANPRSMFAVYYIDSEQYSNTVCCQSNEDNTDTGTYFMLQSRIDLDSSPYLAGYGDDLSGPSFVNQQLLLGMADYDGTTARLFKNGTQANSEAKTYNTYNGEFHIGAFSEAGNIQEKFGGKIAEIVVYSRVLTIGERQQVEAYLNDKYTIY